MKHSLMHWMHCERGSFSQVSPTVFMYNFLFLRITTADGLVVWDTTPSNQNVLVVDNRVVSILGVQTVGCSFDPGGVSSLICKWQRKNSYPFSKCVCSHYS